MPCFPTQDPQNGRSTAEIAVRIWDWVDQMNAVGGGAREEKHGRDQSTNLGRGGLDELPWYMRCIVEKLEGGFQKFFERIDID